MPRSWKRGKTGGLAGGGTLFAGVPGSLDVPAMQVSGADEEHVAFLDLEAASLLGGENVFGHDAFASFEPVHATHHGRVHEDAAGDDAVLGELD